MSSIVQGPKHMADAMLLGDSSTIPRHPSQEGELRNDGLPVEASLLQRELTEVEKISWLRAAIQSGCRFREGIPEDVRKLFKSFKACIPPFLRQLAVDHPRIVLYTTSGLTSLMKKFHGDDLASLSAFCSNLKLHKRTVAKHAMKFDLSRLYKREFLEQMVCCLAHSAPCCLYVCVQFISSCQPSPQF
jgi:hypothetical protein